MPEKGLMVSTSPTKHDYKLRIESLFRLWHSRLEIIDTLQRVFSERPEADFDSDRKLYLADLTEVRISLPPMAFTP